LKIVQRCAAVAAGLLATAVMGGTAFAATPHAAAHHTKHVTRTLSRAENIALGKKLHYFTPSGGTPVGSAADCGASTGGPGIPGSLFSLYASDQDIIGNNGGTGGATNDCGQAGYLATGHIFRFAKATIVVPNHFGDPAFDESIYVDLNNDNGGSINGDAQIPNYAKVGIQPCSCGGSGWRVFTAVLDPNLGTPVFNFVPIPVGNLGDGIQVSVYYDQQGNSVDFSITLPNSKSFAFSVLHVGTEYRRAFVGADWGIAAVNSGFPSPVSTSPLTKNRDSQVFNAAFTTLSGQGKTGIAGPWTLNGVQATSNGFLSPSGTLIGDPSALWRNVPTGQNLGIWRYQN
jgi:hypothetical protein